MAFCNFSTEYIANNDTKVDNIFINEYLPKAPENCIKVYIYGLYLCNANNILDNELSKFAQHLELDEDEVITCFMYWEEEGLVKVLSVNPIEIRYVPIKNVASSVKLYKTDKYETFNKQAQELYTGERQISKSEYGEYYDFLERYHMQQEALLMVMKYCIDSKKSTVGYNYILTVAKNWANEGVLTVEAVEEKLCQFEEKSTEIGLVLSILGLKRPAFIEEKTLFKKWTDELNFNNDVILFIAKKLKQKPRANFEKIDSYIMKYYSLGLFSVIEIENYESKKAELYNLAKQVNNSIGVYYENLETVVDNYISQWINLGFTEDAIVEIASYCRKTSIRTLEGVNDKIQKFFKLGILTTDALHSYLEGILSIDKEIQQILNRVGLPRKVNYLDREFFKTWKENWNMPNDVIDHATSSAIGKTQPMQYINSILSNWYQKGIKTLAEAKSQQMTQINNTAVKPSNFQGRSYKKEELDALIQSIDEVEI